MFPILISRSLFANPSSTGNSPNARELRKLQINKGRVTNINLVDTRFYLMAILSIKINNTSNFCQNM